MNRNEPGVDRDGHYSRNEPYDTVMNRVLTGMNRNEQ